MLDVTWNHTKKTKLIREKRQKLNKHMYVHYIFTGKFTCTQCHRVKFVSDVINDLSNYLYMTSS